MSLDALLSSTGAFRCIDCGKCSSACPISGKEWSDFSPRIIVEKAVMKGDSIYDDPALWECITCGLCTEACESAVDFPAFLRRLRREAAQRGNAGSKSHSGAIHLWNRLMADESIRPDRLGWLPENSKTSEKGNDLFFVSCAPLYAVYFRELGIDLTDSPRATVKILNALGITPAVMKDERCCGHDLLWTGDTEGFKALARLNAERIRDTGAKRMIFSCPECYATFKKDYAPFIGDTELEMVHISELIADAIGSGQLEMTGELKETATYHDACRLGRHMGIYEAPREALAGIQGLRLVEMERTRERAACCGTCAWTDCDAFSKRLQLGRLKEAEATGASSLITPCHKCRIHFSCAQSDKLQTAGERVPEIEVEDFTVTIARGMGLWPDKGGKDDG